MCSDLWNIIIDDLDSSTKDENFECIDSSDASETEKSYIEYSNKLADSVDDDIGNAREWCEITASGFKAFSVPFCRYSGVTFPININHTPLVCNGKVFRFKSNEYNSKEKGSQPCITRKKSNSAKGIKILPQ